MLTGITRACCAYQGPDALFDQEYYYLLALASLEQGSRLLEGGEPLRAVPLLEKLHRGSIYYREDLERRRKQLLLRAYELLEQYYKEHEDYQKAYRYACKTRALSPR